MRIAAWNILHGGGHRRMATIIVELLELQADVIILNEFRATMGGQLQAVLRDHGFAWQVLGGDPREANVVLVAGKVELEKGVIPPGNLSNRLVEVKLKESGVTVIGVHIPDESQPTRRREAWQWVANRAKTLSVEKCVIAGDFNTGRHKVDEAGETFTCTTFLGKLATAGYADAFRTLHGRKWEETWVAPNGAKPLGKSELSGFRLDGGFVSEQLREKVAKAEYGHEVRTKRVSDHSIFMLEIDISGEALQKICKKSREIDQ